MGIEIDKNVVLDYRNSSYLIRIIESRLYIPKKEDNVLEILHANDSGFEQIIRNPALIT